MHGLCDHCGRERRLDALRTARGLLALCEECYTARTEHEVARVFRDVPGLLFAGPDGWGAGR